MQTLNVYFIFQEMKWNEIKRSKKKGKQNTTFLKNEKTKPEQRKVKQRKNTKRKCK